MNDSGDSNFRIHAMECWNYNFNRFNGPNELTRDSRAVSVASPSNVALAVHFDRREIRMAWYVGKIAVLTGTKQNPDMIALDGFGFNPIWIDDRYLLSQKDEYSAMIVDVQKKLISIQPKNFIHSENYDGFKWRKPKLLNKDLKQSFLKRCLNVLTVPWVTTQIFLVILSEIILSQIKKIVSAREEGP